MPRSAARSAGPMNTPSTPSTRAIASIASAPRLDLHEHGHLVVRAMQVVTDAIPPRRTRQRTPHATNPVRRITRRRHRRARLVGALHHRNEQRLCARSSTCLTITGSFHGTRTTGCDGYGAIACSCARIVGTVFGACSPSISSQSKPAPATTSALYGFASEPQPDLRVATRERRLEDIRRNLHRSLTSLEVALDRPERAVVDAERIARPRRTAA